MRLLQHDIIGRDIYDEFATEGRSGTSEDFIGSIVVCCLPIKSPWLNPIEPKWVHGKRAIVEPARLLAAHEVTERVCAYYSRSHEDHLAIPDKVA